MPPADITVISLLVGAVGALWKIVVTNHKKTEKRLDECEVDRTKLFAAIKILASKINVPETDLPNEEKSHHEKN